TLRIIVEQSIEWNSSLYINFINYEKAFDSVDRTTLRKLLRHYGVPQKIVNIIQNSYDGSNCKIVHGGQLIDSFEIKTGVRQGCLLSPFLFLLLIDWIMKTSKSGEKYEIQWTSRMQLDDLDTADDLALLSQTQQQMQEKTNSVAAVSAAIHKTDRIPELSLYYSETHSDDQFGRNNCRMDLLLELELARVCLGQIESEIALERSRQKGREHHNQVVDDKVMSYKFTSASPAVDVPPGKD
ncbi:unnamed protein product, partial [Schistosoma curassoni]|uniref:Reverse transcriptase domain-containing protein n=1 Tax=Schistosoma curassoni TaxID=6186 RepID=A0A183KU10_9TREM